MSILVVDAAFLVHAVMTRDGAIAQWTLRLLSQAGLLLAPHLVHVELTSALRKMVQKKLISRAEMRAGLQNALDLDLQLEPFEPHAERVLELVDNVTPYDAWYVAIAEAWDAPLATGDNRLHEAAGPRCKILVP